VNTSEMTTTTEVQAIVDAVSHRLPPNGPSGEVGGPIRSRRP